MRRQATEIIKDFIVSILIVVCICLILSIAFYDKISLGKVIPKAEQYALTKEMQTELEDSKLKNTQEVIINYYIDASDLKKYEKTNEYIKGKGNPFAEFNTIITENNVSSNTSNNGAQGGFYEDDGSK